MEDKEYELIIIGAGPAGLTAGIYAARFRIKTLIVGKLPGGVAGEAHKICNFPSWENITGFELMKKMMEQVKNLGVKIIPEEVLDIKKTGEKNSENFEIITKKNKYIGKKIILATGLERARLGIDNEENLIGKGISYCATCDAGFYKDKIVGIVGGSNSALSSAVLLSNFAKKIYIMHRKNKFEKAEPIWIDEIKSNPKIIIRFNSDVTKLIGRDKLEEIEINNKEKIKVDGVFIEIGGIPNIKLAEILGLKIQKRHIVVDRKQKTNIKGVFAAGDITNNPLKQIITACAEGAVAVKSAYESLKEKK